MNSKHTLSTTNARKILFQITKDVQTPGIHFTLTENGKPKAVLLSAQEFESWQETLEVMSQNPNLAAELELSEAELSQGKFEDLDDLITAENKLNLVSDKKGKYVSSSANQKRTQAKK